MFDTRQLFDLVHEALSRLPALNVDPIFARAWQPGITLTTFDKLLFFTRHWLLSMFNTAFKDTTIWLIAPNFKRFNRFGTIGWHFNHYKKNRPIRLELAILNRRMHDIPLHVGCPGNCVDIVKVSQAKWYRLNEKKNRVMEDGHPGENWNFKRGWRGLLNKSPKFSKSRSSLPEITGKIRLCSQQIGVNHLLFYNQLIGTISVCC